MAPPAPWRAPRRARLRNGDNPTEFRFSQGHLRFGFRTQFNETSELATRRNRAQASTAWRCSCGAAEIVSVEPATPRHADSLGLRSKGCVSYVGSAAVGHSGPEMHLLLACSRAHYASFRVSMLPSGKDFEVEGA